jgi:hypothetical protein
MRQVLLGLIGVMMAGAGHAETYSFTALLQSRWSFQTRVHCDEPAKGKERVPSGCTLSKRAVAYPNVGPIMKSLRPFYPGAACAAGHPIAFHLNGTLASCELDGEQSFELVGAPGIGSCFGFVTFDENGFAGCN